MRGRKAIYMRTMHDTFHQLYSGLLMKLMMIEAPKISSSEVRAIEGIVIVLRLNGEG